MKSICNDETLRKLSSGKVGNMFLLSKDDRFLIKILRKSEIKVPPLLIAISKICYLLISFYVSIFYNVGNT